MTILDQIDRAASGLCPCGAPPAEGSAYCSDDCLPTHISSDTDTREVGHLATPMRWRPDLVTVAPDDGLTRICEPIRLGRLTRSIYDRDGTDSVHVRLDDGHRFVGTDVERLGGGEQFAERCQHVWQRLERELISSRHAEPVDCDMWPDGDDPWADVFAQVRLRYEEQAMVSPFFGEGRTRFPR